MAPPEISEELDRERQRGRLETVRTVAIGVIAVVACAALALFFVERDERKSGDEEAIRKNCLAINQQDENLVIAVRAIETGQINAPEPAPDPGEVSAFTVPAGSDQPLREFIAQANSLLSALGIGVEEPEDADGDGRPDSPFADDLETGLVPLDCG